MKLDIKKGDYVIIEPWTGEIDGVIRTKEIKDRFFEEPREVSLALSTLLSVIDTSDPSNPNNKHYWYVPIAQVRYVINEFDLVLFKAGVLELKNLSRELCSKL